MSRSKGYNVKKKNANVKMKPATKKTTETSEKEDSTLSARKVAVEVQAWKPFTNPMRNINTSTK